MQDFIKREVFIASSMQKVFDAISNPEKVIKWFPETLEGKYSVGEQPIFGFGAHGKNRILIVDSKPYHYFSYRWVPGASHFTGDLTKVKTTVVEFRIEEIDVNKCKVTLTESGFSNLPVEVMESSFKQNSGGWDFMLGRLKEYFGV